MIRRCTILVAFFLTGLCAAKGQSFEWRWMNSPITAFAQRPGSPDMIFAGDRAGLIRMSSDRGASWRLVSQVSEAQITDIKFLDDRTGFAGTTQSGLLLMTSDGGMNWTRKQFIKPEEPWNPYPYPAIARVVPVNATTAFFDIFNHPISGSMLKMSIVTRDGGKSFSLDSMPGEVYHISGNTLMAFGREAGQFGLAKFTVYKSTDLGMKWDTVKIAPEGLPNTFNNNGMNLAFFLSENEYFLTANKNIGNDDNLYKTTDGGKTFAVLPEFPDADADFIYFRNSSEGLAITGSTGGKMTFYTTDGGATWTAVENGGETTALYIGNDSFIAYKNDHTTISTDFGRTWTEQADPFNTVRNSGGTPGIHFMKMVNDSTAIMSIGKIQSGVGSGSELVRTTNGGLTWHMLQDASGKAFKGRAFHFVSADTFFYIGSGYNDQGQGGYMKIKYTTDGGKTAQDLFTGNYWEDVAQIIFIDRDHAVTWASNGSSINYSTDAGKTWVQTKPGPFGQVMSMAAPSTDAWYIREYNGKIFRSGDQGNSWTDITGMASCGDLHFSDASTGFVFGCKEKIFKTTDGGQNWVDVSSGLADNIRYNNNTTMDFRTAAEGYMGASNANGSRAISRTTDGGNTWHWYNASQINSNYMTKVDFIDENTGALIDVFGNFARYTGPVTFTTDTIALQAGPVSVGEFSAEKAFTLYPNPAADHIIIRSEGADISWFEITDLLGGVLLRQQNAEAAGSYRLSVAGLPAGIYCIRAGGPGGSFTQRLSIVR